MERLDFNSTLVSSHQSQRHQGCAYGLAGDGNSEPLDHVAVSWKNKMKVLLRDEMYIRFVQISWLMMVLFSVNCHYLGAQVSLWTLFGMAVWYKEFMSICLLPISINGEESHILFYFFFFKLGRTEEQRKAVENC